MIIQFNSWHETLVFFLALGAVLTAAATLHWKVFAEPLLRKIFTPFGERLDTVTRVTQRMHPTEFRDAESETMRDRALRRAI